MTNAKLLLVGLGDLGRRTAADLVESGLGTIAAAVDSDAGKAGRRLGEIVPETGSELVVASSVDEVELGDLDGALVLTSSHLPDCAATLRPLLRAGLAVASTCEELVHPWLRHPELADELDALARRHGARLLGTGVNPGFLMDALPGILTAACVGLRSVRVERGIDASRRRAAFQRKVGAGWALADFEAALAEGRAGHVGLGESLHLLAELAGLSLDRWEETAEAVAAEHAIDSAEGPIPKGAAAGVRQVARGFGTSGCVVELTFEAGLHGVTDRDRVVLDGEPPLEMVLEGGLHGDIATSAIALHALQALRDQPPGLTTMGRLPLSRRGFRPR